MTKIIIHKDRAVIEVKGAERRSFLQGLVTNDVNKVDDGLIYCAMLNPQGRFLYDFFVFEEGDRLFIDCLAKRREEILKKLAFYKLRAKVEISPKNMICAQVFEQCEGLCFADPRNNHLGFRVYFDEKPVLFEEENYDKYSFLRISHKIAEGEWDLVYEKSFILEFGFDDLQAIDYQKGCYIGQELTARTHYRGQIRKMLVHIILNEEQKLQKGQKFSCEGKNLGIVLSSVFYEGKFHILALVRLDDVDGEVEFELNNIEFEQI